MPGDDIAYKLTFINRIHTPLYANFEDLQLPIYIGIIHNI